jgi:hypothetical protein
VEGPGIGLSGPGAGPGRPRPAVAPRGRCRAALTVAVVVVLALAAAACGTSERPAAAGSKPSPGATSTHTAHPATTFPSHGTTSTLPAKLATGANTIYVLSDSVILGAQPQIQAALPGWQVTFDSKVSRSIYSGISILQHLTGPPPRVVIIHLCTNWSQPTFGHEIDEAMAALPTVQRVIWVTCTPWNPGVSSADAAIGVASVQYRPRVVVADWAAISATPGYTYDDHLHLKAAGAEAMAALLAPLVGPAPVAPGSTPTVTSTGSTASTTP